MVFIRSFDMAAAHKFNFAHLGRDIEISPSDTFVDVLDLGAYLDEL